MLKEKKLELHQLIEKHDVDGFRQFLKENKVQAKGLKIISELPDEDLSLYMHQMKATDMSYGDLRKHSRNVLRANQFGYGDNLPEHKCAECKFFRDKPAPDEIPGDAKGDPNNEMPCMHLGSIPEDVICPEFKPIPPQGVTH